MIKSITNQIRSKPNLFFLIDGLGAILSAFLTRWQESWVLCTRKTNKKSKLMRYLLVIFIFSSLYTFAQIPNFSFEEWDNIDNYEKPRHWDTNQGIMYARIEKDTIAVDGDYSLKFLSNIPTAWFDCPGRIQTGIGFGTQLGEGMSISFYAKSIPLEDSQWAFLGARQFCYSDGN